MDQNTLINFYRIKSELLEQQVDLLLSFLNHPLTEEQISKLSSIYNLMSENVQSLNNHLKKDD